MDLNFHDQIPSERTIAAANNTTAKRGLLRLAPFRGGANLARLFFYITCSLLGGPTINNSGLNLTALVVSFIGAVILLAIVNLVRRGTVR